MLEQGTIIKIDNNQFWIEMDTSSRCSDCGGCSKAAEGKMIMPATSTVNANLGDLVEVETSKSGDFLAPILIFGIPLFFIIFGVFVGNTISELVSIISGFLFFGIGLLVLKIVDRFIGKKRKLQSKIVRVLSRIK